MRSVELGRRVRTIAFIVFAVASASAASAQSLPSGRGSGRASTPAPLTASAVLANVQQYYANANQLTAQFRQVVTNATFNSTQTSDGTLWVAKPAQFRWDYLQKKNKRVNVTKTFIFDGQTFWLIDHGNKQIVRSQVQNSTLPAAVSFLSGGANLSSQFNVALNTTGTYAATSSVVLELTPKQVSAQYSKLFFVVDPSDWRVKESIVIDTNGDTNTFRFYQPNLTAPIKAHVFQVSPARLPNYNLIVPGAQGAAGSSAGGSGSPTSTNPPRP